MLFTYMNFIPVTDSDQVILEKIHVNIFYEQVKHLQNKMF